MNSNIRLNNFTQDDKAKKSHQVVPGAASAAVNMKTHGLGKQRSIEVS